MVFKRKFAPKRKLIRRKKWARKPRTVNVNRALHPIPQRFITKLKYSDIVYTGASGHFGMNMNSLFDPNASGGGHQPYGFDQLALLYNRYRVISCSYRLNVGVGTTTVPFIFTAMPANVNVAATTASEIRENPRARYVTQNPGAGVVVLHGKSYLPSIVGRNKAQYMADDRYQATVLTDPSEQIILNIQTFDMAGATIANIPIQVVMEFTAEFFDIKSLGQS